MKTKHVLLLTSVGVLVLGLRIFMSAPSIMLEAFAFQLGVDEGALVPTNTSESSSKASTRTTRILGNATSTTKTQLPAATQQQTRAIFYNIFIAPLSPVPGNSIVREQLQQMQQAQGHENSTIYYTVIGGQLRGGDGSLCGAQNGVPSSRCQLLGHHEKAHEVVTLQAMYEYCVAHPDHHVTYLHDKGSFHAKVGVDRSRRIGTKGALACLLNDNDNGSTTTDMNSTQCNVCADYFSTHPHSHVPGNFFAAQCQYISQLIPPKAYEQSRRNVCHFIHRHADTIAANPKVDISFCPPATTAGDDAIVKGGSGNGNNRTATVNNRTKKKVAAYNGAADSVDVGYGFGRYAMERWVASHPLFHICIVFHNVTKKSFKSGWEFWEPKSLPHFKERKRTSEDERRNLLFLVHEYAHSYGILDTRFNPDYFCQTYFSKYPGVCPLVSKEFRAAWAAEYGNDTTKTTNVANI